MELPDARPTPEQVIRQAQAHHIQLSASADIKANMLLTISAVVMTLAFRYLSDPGLCYTAGMIIASCLLTILLAAYAAMPKLRMRSRPRDPDSPDFNLFFFGDFSALSLTDYHERVKDLLRDPARTYDAMVREVYLLGQYLAGRKYRFISLGYLCFLSGMFLSVVVWLVSRLAGAAIVGASAF